MKNSKLWKILYTLIFLVQLAAEAITLTAILRLKMLPTRYAVLVVAAFVLGLLITALLLFIRPRKGKRAIGRRIIACLLALAIAAGSIFGYTVADKVHDTMTSITDTGDKEQTGETRQIFVLADDPAQTLMDARDYTFGMVENYDITCTQGALAYMEQELNQPIKIAAYTSIYEMVDALYAGDCDAILLNGGYVSILADTEQYMDFMDRTRILCDVPVMELTPPQNSEQPNVQKPDDSTAPTDPVQTTEPTEPEGPLDVTEDPFIMYISGSDTRAYRLSRGNSDVNILVVVNPKTKQILMVNTPRDYYIPNPAGDGALDKLTHCGIYSIDCSIQALSDLYGIEVDYYSQINFTGFERLVDAVGGVVVNSPVGFTVGDVTINKGLNYLGGKEALVFARDRHHMPGGDNGRGQNQMKVIEAIIEKATSGTTIITNYAQILESLQGLFVTSMEMEEISSLVRMQLDDMAEWNIQRYAVTGENGRAITYSIPGLYASVMYQDDGRVAYGTELIERVMAGQVLTDEDVKYPG